VRGTRKGLGKKVTRLEEPLFWLVVEQTYLNPSDSRPKVLMSEGEDFQGVLGFGIRAVRESQAGGLSSLSQLVVVAKTHALEQ
jgi:hypothetical protein